MTTAPDFEKIPGVQDVTMELADIVPFPPTQEGFLGPEVFGPGGIEGDDRPYVVDWKELGRERSRHGLTTTSIATMQNGRKLEVVLGEPRQQRVDFPIVKTTALGTSIRGHNWHNLFQGMDLGYPMVMVGPEGGHAHVPRNVGELQTFLRNLGNITLAEMAENMHAILDFTDSFGAYEPGTVINTGESKGAMTAMGFKAREGKFDRHVLYQDLTAPCFPVPRREIERHPALPLETVKQTALIGRIPLKMNVRRVMHYPATLNLNPYYLLHMVASIPALLDGSAGELAREIPNDAKIHNTLFTGDTWSFPEGWDEIFADHPHVVNTRRPGNHMGIAHELTLTERRGRLAGLREELTASHHDRERINWDSVHMAGKLLLAAS